MTASRRGKVICGGLEKRGTILEEWNEYHSLVVRMIQYMFSEVSMYLRANLTLDFTMRLSFHRRLSCSRDEQLLFHESYFVPPEMALAFWGVD